MRKIIPCLLSLILLLTLAAGNLPALAAPASTYVVNTVIQAADISPGNDVCLDTNGKCSLTAAVMEANAHAGADTITVMAGTHDLTQRLEPTEALTINGANKTTTIINGAGSGGAEAFRIRANVTFSNLTIKNFPRAIYIQNTESNHTVSISNSILEENVNADGGYSGSAVANYCTTCTVNLSGVDVRDNASPYCGAISSRGTLNLSNQTLVHNNQATSTYGGGICNNEGRLSVTQSLIYGNSSNLTSGGFGGGIYLNGGSTTIFLSEIYNNSALHGAGIYIDGDADFNAQNTQIYSNDATGSGGGMMISSDGYVVLEDSILRENSASYGGGVYAWSSAKIAHTTIISNTATTKGGGLYANDGGLNVINTTFSGNRSNGNGGGIYTANSSVVRLANVTITNNSANADQEGDDFGGGVYQDSSSQIRFKNSIIANNKDLKSDPFDLQASDCYGTLTSDGFNLVGRLSYWCSLTGDQSGLLYNTNDFLDPKLGPLTFYAAEYYYHPLLFGPAVDAGNPSGCKDFADLAITRDQIGSIRPYNPALAGYTPRCDLGAIESSKKVFRLFLPALVR